ncbi:hypothetical protein [Marispirochaeta aestuarii]|uniref:hypothetical protein n=1 Tax=Marispirochaeta aestuarii TaxID=1963862 RepID=UPI0029C65D55|nr:hypothetical protein [Marispirochaeta aestuarii]
MRVYILAVIAVAFFSVIGLVLFYSPEKQNSENAAVVDADAGVYSRLILPEEKRGLIANDHLPLRSRRLEWTRDQVDRFWIPPGTIVLEIMKDENDAILEEIFESVP